MDAPYSKTLIVYDSQYGNTRIVAEAIEKACRQHGDTQLVLAKDAMSVALDGVDMLIVGSPTQGGRPTPAVQKFIDALPNLEGMPIAAFDTRFTRSGHGFALNILMRTIGFAAPKISTSLLHKGGRMAMPPAGFIVSDTEGPLQPGELTRITEWASALPKSVRV